jgi:hypothetical protein
MTPRTSAYTLGLAFSALAFLTATSHAQSFTFPSFTSNNGLQVNGNASTDQTGKDGTSKVLRLTPAQGDQAGSAFSLNTVHLGSNASFSTAFSFQMWDGGGISDGTSNPLGADGIVFVLNTGSNLVGSLGQGVGYQGIANSVGIKFDTWQDASPTFPQDNDPNGNFVGIYTDGSTQFGNAPGDASTVFSPGDSMKNGAVWFAWVDYNGNTDDLQVRLSETDVRPASASLDETIDLNDPSILGSSPAVFAGFTSGTGGAWDNNDILNWQFNDTFNPITVVGSVPDQGPGLTVLAVVMLGVCGFAARKTRRSLRA